MKKLAVWMLVVVLLTPSHAHAIFGSECRSLKKRTIANQVKYEKAWDSYQTTLAQFISSKPSTTDIYTRNPVIPRFKAVGQIQETILSDFVKSPKCWSKKENIDWKSELINLKKILANSSGFQVYSGKSFSELWDFPRSLN
jgi:hypothetical protein